MGGNAIKSSSRINQENVASTIEDINNILLPHLNIKIIDTSLLGSTGKKLPGGSSGDIDLAVSYKSISENNNLNTSKEIFDFIIEQSKKFTYEIKDLRQMGLISIAWPISNDDGKQDGLYVQLDLMLVDSIDWATWAYYSPAEWESPWKGLYRNEILYAVAKYMDYKSIESLVDDKYKDLVWERDFFDLGNGLFRGTQSRKGKKGPTKIARTLHKSLITNDPSTAVKMMFGTDCIPSELLTWDDVFKCITKDNFVHKKFLYEILLMTKEGIESKDVPVPMELLDEIEGYNK